MLEVKNVDILLSTRYLVKSLSFNVGPNDKLAIIGEEGNGKSTLLKAIVNACDYAQVTGTIDHKNCRIGYLEQLLNEETLEKKVFDYLFETEEVYYEKISEFYTYSHDLMIDENILKLKMKNLSGGEKVKICILKLLLEENDIFILDEPTNDLDIETLLWLEKFINDTKKPIVYVSHDETLLSNTANMILHLEQIADKTSCRHTVARSDYDSYVKLRLRSLSKQEQIAKSEKRKFAEKWTRLQRIMNKVEHQQRTISRSDPHGAQLLKKKMHSLKSQEKRLEKTELTQLPDVEESINFFFGNVQIPKNKTILDLYIPKIEVDNKTLATNIELKITGNAHLCIIGNNGSGKTTLIKRIYEELKNRTDIKVGYMPQNYDDILSAYERVLDFASPSKSKDDITKTRTLLGNMNFTKDEMTGSISYLSNGSKAKLFLVYLVLSNCDVLILDEPTRNVSPLSNPVIRNVLSNYKGTIISISHDRKYIEEVIDTLYILDKTGLKKVL